MEVLQEAIQYIWLVLLALGVKELRGIHTELGYLVDITCPDPRHDEQAEAPTLQGVPS